MKKIGYSKTTLIKLRRLYDVFFAIIYLILAIEIGVAIHIYYDTKRIVMKTSMIEYCWAINGTPYTEGNKIICELKE